MRGCAEEVVFKWRVVYMCVWEASTCLFFVFTCMYIVCMLCVCGLCVLQMPSPLFPSVFLSLFFFFLQLGLPKHQQEESAGGKNKARKTLGVVNVKQIIKYGEKTTEKRPTVLRQHMLIRLALLHWGGKIKKQTQTKNKKEEGRAKKNGRRKKVRGVPLICEARWRDRCRLWRPFLVYWQGSLHHLLTVPWLLKQEHVAKHI